MRKTINTLALLTFVWLLLDALNIPNMLLNFLLAGELPIIGTSISPAIMLAIMTLTAGVVVFELLARRLDQTEITPVNQRH